MNHYEGFAKSFRYTDVTKSCFAEETKRTVFLPKRISQLIFSCPIILPGFLDN